MNLRKKKLLFASVDLGWRIHDYSSFLTRHPELGLNPKSIVYYYVKKSFYPTTYDVRRNIHDISPAKRMLWKLWYFSQRLFTTDIFHFFSGETLLNRTLRPIEFNMYRILGKRLVMHFVGSDVRNPEMLFSRSNQLKESGTYVHSELEQQQWQKKLVKDAEKYAHEIIVSTPDLLRLFKNATYFPVLLDIDRFNEDIEIAKKMAKPKSPHEIMVLHCPSSPKTKGSDYIDFVMERVIQSSPHKIRYINTSHAPTFNDTTHYQVTRRELFALMLEADIVIDQMVIGWYGLQAVEALMTGSKVICHIQKEYESYLFPECPVIRCETNELESTLMAEVARSANGPIDSSTQREWVLKNHTIEHQNAALLSAWGVESIPLKYIKR